MDDAELITRVRSSGLDVTADRLADRLAELVAENERLLAELNRFGPGYMMGVLERDALAIANSNLRSELLALTNISTETEATNAD